MKRIPRRMDTVRRIPVTTAQQLQKRKEVSFSMTVLPIFFCNSHNGLSDYISYSHDGRADYISYSLNGRADYVRYSHDGR